MYVCAPGRITSPDRRLGGGSDRDVGMTSERRETAANLLKLCAGKQMGTFQHHFTISWKPEIVISENIYNSTGSTCLVKVGVGRV